MKGPRPPLRSHAREGTRDAAVRVRVPATSANLGPAFDCAGVALRLHDVVEFSLLDRGQLKIVSRGEGAGLLATDETHLVARAFRAGCAELGWDAPGLRIEADNAIPQGRGMGSSAAAVVAGLLGAWALCPDVEDVDPDAVLRVATRLEGHPDNVAPCLLGGATLSWTADDGARAARLAVHEDVRPVVLVPGTTLPTSIARGLLPELVPHADAAFNAGRSALLVHALTAEPELLLAATEDRLHQRQRGAAMPESLELVDRLRAAGYAAVVSGAGPSVLVLARRTAVQEVTELTPAGWQALPLEVDATGARVLSDRAEVSS